MNEYERYMIRSLLNNDIKAALQYAKIVLERTNGQKDQKFKEAMLEKLSDIERRGIEIPPNLKGILELYNSAKFPQDRFLLRPSEEDVVKKVINTYRAAGKLAELTIPFLPAVMLYGKSGCGKTMLAKYIAYKTNLPFLYIKFSSLVRSHLGETQGNIGRIFAFVRQTPCVLCFDEIDAIGAARGNTDDVAEMDRVVISLMQELDEIPNNVVVVGTTNRFDTLDPALIRRFPIHHMVMPLSYIDSWMFAKKFLNYVGYYEKNETEVKSWFETICCPANSLKAEQEYPASEIVKKCTDFIVDKIINEYDEEALL